MKKTILLMPLLLTTSTYAQESQQDKVLDKPKIEQILEKKEENKQRETWLTDVPRSITLDTGLWPSFYNNRAHAKSTLELNQLTTALFDVGKHLLNPQSFAERSVYGSLFSILALPMLLTPRYTLHEFGHASRMAALGLSPIYGNGRGEKMGESYFPLLANSFVELYKGFFTAKLFSAFTSVGGVALIKPKNIDLNFKNSDQYFDKEKVQQYNYSVEFLKKIADENYGGDIDQAFLILTQTVMNPSSLTKSPKGFEDYEDWSAKEVADRIMSYSNIFTAKGGILVYGGGVNNSSYASYQRQNEAWFHGQQHYMDQLYSLVYSIYEVGAYADAETKAPFRGDVSGLVSNYKKLNINTSQREIILTNLIGQLLSYDLYSALYYTFSSDGVYFSGNYVLPVKDFYGFHLPNIGFYFTTRGLSYLVNTGYKYSDTLFFPAAVEYVFRGETAFEVTLGVRKMFPEYYNTYIHAETRVGPLGVNGLATVGVKPLKDFEAEIGVAMYDNQSLYGERHASFTKDRLNFELWAGVRYYY